MDIRGQYEALLPEIKRLVSDVIDSGRFILGPNVRALEDEVEASIGYGHAVAVANGTALIEDAAQAFGASFEDHRAGSYGDVATFSFFPTKNLPAMGDAGMAIASSEEVAERLRELRFHGSRDKRTFEHIGVNSRLDEIQAAILRRFLPEVGGWNALRQAVADRYRDLGLGEHVSLPAVAPQRTHIYHL